MTGRARLSYRRAAELFEADTASLPGGPWTLHQLRHSALTHATDYCGAAWMHGSAGTVRTSIPVERMRPRHAVLRTMTGMPLP